MQMANTDLSVKSVSTKDDYDYDYDYDYLLCKPLYRWNL